jgi:predicted PurR-regulated permease PerM
MKNVSAFLVCIIVFFVVVFPFLYLLNYLLIELPQLYTWMSSAIQTSKVWHDIIYEKLANDFGVYVDIGSLLQSIISSMIGYAKEVLASIPSKILNVSVAGFALFFFLRDGREILRTFFYNLPLSSKDSLIILRELKQMADAVLYGQLITALVQSSLATLAYFVMGFQAPLFWGFLTFVFALIPMVGPAFVYLPMSLSMIIGSYDINSFGVIKGVLLLFYGVGVISTVDNIIKPLLISDKVRIHPMFILLGVVGGLATFGVIGLILGPLILAFLVTLFNIYKMREDISDHMEHSNK